MTITAEQTLEQRIAALPQYRIVRSSNPERNGTVGGMIEESEAGLVLIRPCTEPRMGWSDESQSAVRDAGFDPGSVWVHRIGRRRVEPVEGDAWYNDLPDGRVIRASSDTRPEMVEEWSGRTFKVRDHGRSSLNVLLLSKTEDAPDMFNPFGDSGFDNSDKYRQWYIARTSVEIIDPEAPPTPEPVPVEQMGKKALREALAAAQAAHKADVAHITDHLIREAEDRSWCDEYDTIVSRMNMGLTEKVGRRRRRVNRTLSGTITYTTSRRLVVPEDATHEELEVAFLEHIRGHVDSQAEVSDVNPF